MEDTTAVVGGKKSMEKTGDAYHMLEPGGPLAPPIFGRSVNPFPTRGRIMTTTLGGVLVLLVTL